MAQGRCGNCAQRAQGCLALTSAYVRLLPQALRGRARRDKDQSLPIQQTFARQKFDQKRRPTRPQQKPLWRNHGRKLLQT